MTQKIENDFARDKIMENILITINSLKVQNSVFGARITAVSFHKLWSKHGTQFWVWDKSLKIPGKYSYCKRICRKKLYTLNRIIEVTVICCITTSHTHSLTVYRTSLWRFWGQIIIHLKEIKKTLMCGNILSSKPN